MLVRVGRAPWAAALIALLPMGCATQPRIDYTPDAMRREIARRGLDPGEVVVPFEVGRESVDHARRLLRGLTQSEDRAKGLVEALASPEGFGLRYQWAESQTAAETLARGGGNCFALSSALIGLMRGIGLKAYYVEVVVAEPEWRMDGDVAVYADRIAAMILTPNGRVFVDFSGRLARGHSVRVIGDFEALAHYYNNRGYRTLHRAEIAGEPVPWEVAERDFDVATRVHPGLARAWNNLGVARARVGDLEGARAAYNAALERDAGIQSAHVNLAVLDLREGDEAGARAHLRAAELLDPRNPQLEELLGSSQAPPDASEPALGG